MRVLAACEYSGRVREAFRKLGHDAWSCDILPSDDGSPYHIQGDALEAISRGWDLVIAFPPCTHLSAAGARYWPEKQADGRQQEAVDFVKAIHGCSAPMVAVENPLGILSTVWRKPDQIINPFDFGEPQRKRTCLWLKGLPKLVPTEVVAVEPSGFAIRKTGPKAGKRYNYYYHQSKDAHRRSLTFQGIADAMADQWGKITQDT